MALLTRLALVAALVGCGPNRTYPDRAAYQPAEPAALTCVPNLDGRLEAAEAQAALGVPLRLLVNPAGTSRPVEVAGVVTSGRRSWALGTDWADDRVATLTARALSGAWYAASFPQGQFVSPLDVGGALEGVYQATATELLLHGYASAADGAAKTLVRYTQPVAVARYPLEVGAAWVAVGEVRNATVRGLPYAGRDTYQLRVDSAGQLELPDVTFTQALQLRTTLTIEPAVGTPVVRRQVGWLFECFGEVARATAADNEPSPDFTTAQELRRLGF